MSQSSILLANWIRYEGSSHIWVYRNSCYDVCKRATTVSLKWSVADIDIMKMRIEKTKIEINEMKMISFPFSSSSPENENENETVGAGF